MVNGRRKSLLVVLLILLFLPIAVGSIAGIGSVELTIWLVLLVGWLAAFLFWGGRGSRPIA